VGLVVGGEEGELEGWVLGCTEGCPDGRVVG